MTFTSNKIFNLGSAAFRQWRSTHSHCQYIHGYNLTADITFECSELDDKNWCADFGGFKELKTMFEHTFDHKLVVAGDDPELELFKSLDAAGVAEVVILPDGVGCERFAEFVLNTADSFINISTEGRVRVKSVQINEHALNFATCYRAQETLNVSISQSDSVATNVDAPKDVLVLEDIHGAVASVDPSPAPAPNPNAASVGKTSTKTKGGWFEGTTWG